LGSACENSLCPSFMLLSSGVGLHIVLTREELFFS